MVNLLDEGGDMTDHSGFGGLLTQLLDYRQTDIAWLASVSGILESELRSMIDGAPPSPSQLDDLAAALGFHTADLFVIAGLPVPELLMPYEPTAGAALSRLVKVATALPEDQRAHLRETIERLPQLPYVRPADRPRTYCQGDGGFGEMLVTMLCVNRNLHSPVAATKTLALSTRGRVYLSASTIHSIAAGRAPLKPIWLAGFATTLGIPAADLAAITGIDLSEAALSHDPLAAEMAGARGQERSTSRRRPPGRAAASA
ncbi:hypothetical protein ACWDRB_66710 [Nonomuraea sp. NPDC003707]